ncbi:MAG: 4Fe-4S binding protein [Pseudomonadota bacterium]
MRRFAAEIPIAALGFFALVSQTLLFRDFLATLEGNEIAVGTFFGSWLIWVGAGAVVGRFITLHYPAALSRFLFFSLLYLPASLGQHLLIVSSRSILDLESFILVPLPSLLLFTALANSPTSFLSGFLFSMACTWVAETFVLPVARVYIIETIGGFIGGLFVTGLLTLGIPGEKVFLYAALMFTAAILAHFFQARMHPLWWGPLAICVATAVLAAGITGHLAANRAARNQWSRLLPVDTYLGSFITAQARYLYGERAGDFIVMTEGGVIETLPEEEHASEVTAWAIAENPRTTRVLIVGPGGPAIATRLRLLPQIQEIVWLYPDPDFPERLFTVLPSRIRKAFGNIDVPRQEVRTYLRETTKKFDLVLVNLPEPTTLVLNRYYSTAFFFQVQNVLAQDGVCAVRLSGGANYLSGEQVLKGASTLTTLSSVFPWVALKPGDESFLFASKTNVVSELPTQLVSRLAAVQGSSQLYPKEGLFTSFPQDRISFQKGRYHEAQEKYGEHFLVNTDDHPKALLFDLLLTLRRAGMDSVARIAAFLVDNGTWICLAGILLYGLLRLVFLKRLPETLQGQEKDKVPNLFDIQVILFIAGLVGMSATVVLMFCYQVRFGSLYLDIGLISSLFMLGSAVGGVTCERLLLRRNFTLSNIIMMITVFETIFFSALIFCSPLEASRPALSLLFLAVGILSGFYFPLAAGCLNTGGYRVETAAGRLELLDHLGGAAGALTTGLLLLPLLGVKTSLIILMTTVFAANLLSLLRKPTLVSDISYDWFDRFRRPFGYLLFGVGAFSLLISQGFQTTQSGKAVEYFQVAAAEMEKNIRQGQELKATLTDGSTFLYYHVPGGYIFPSAPLARGIRGYGGEIPLAIWLDDHGILKDFRLLRSNETPVYLIFLRNWLESLKDREMFTAMPLQGIDAVSGATMSSAAIMKTLTRSTTAFGEVVLGHSSQAAATASFASVPSWQFTALLLWTVVTLAARYRPHRWLRRSILLISLVLFGIVLNLQYTSQQVMALLSGNFSWEITSSGFFLVVTIPLVVILFGNVYCGYLCPFGALQEFLGDLRPVRFFPDPRRQVWRYGRFGKYVLLFLLVLLFALTRDFSVLHADPLITIFGAARGRMVTILALSILVFSLFFRRFWCRNLCPAGAFLSLLSGMRLLRYFLPKTRPELCDLGVRNHSELDCLQCDRCRNAKK